MFSKSPVCVIPPLFFSLFVARAPIFGATLQNCRPHRPRRLASQISSRSPLASSLLRLPVPSACQHLASSLFARATSYSLAPLLVVLPKPCKSWASVLIHALRIGRVIASSCGQYCPHPYSVDALVHAPPSHISLWTLF
jgi:hypothetical protein